jgi:hypothetical protein
MRVGFNHNIKYKGEVFHIQTEDSGINNPHIITLLYRGGTIISSRKTSYADIIKMENLDQVVEELMKDQHKEMLRGLKAGVFDERAFGTRTAFSPEGTEKQETEPAPSPVTPSATQQPPREPHRQSQSLDEIILDYLVRGDDA